MEEGGSIVRVLPRRSVLMMMTLFLLNMIESYPAQEWGGVPSKVVDSVRQHFCNGCPLSETATSRCGSGTRRTLCQHACQMEDCPDEQCYKDLSKESNTPCPEFQETLCSFEDAVICQYADGRGSLCVVKMSDKSVPLCICKNQLGSYQLWAVSCNEEDREPYEGENQPNIAVPVLSSVLAVVLVVLLVVAVMLYRWRIRNSPALLNNKTPNGTQDPTSIELESKVSQRVSTPLPRVPGEKPRADFHTYYSLDPNDQGDGSTRYAVHGQNSAPSEADKVQSTEDTNHHEYAVLEKTQSTENIGMSHTDCTTSTTESLPEAPVETESVRSPVLTTAESEPLDRSGYETSVVAPPKENIRSPVLTTAESEPLDRSGYEVALVATPLADVNDSSMYDHFDRSTSRLSNVVDFTDQENSNYQHLEKV